MLTSLVLANIDYLDLSFGFIFFVECIAFIPVGVGMVVIMLLGERYPLLFSTLSYSNISKHIGIALAIFIIHAFWQPYMNAIFFGDDYMFQYTLRDFIAFLEMRFLIYVIIVGLVSGLIKIREQKNITIKQSELNLKLQKARIRELELKMNPEIIYPNLGFIRDKAERNPELASQMVILMAGILRKLVDNMEAEQAKISDEAQFFKKYSELLKLRLERSFSLNINLPGDIKEERVPSLILSIPLFEELFFGRYKGYLSSVTELIFTAKRIFENGFEICIQIRGIYEEQLVEELLKEEPLIDIINELLGDLPTGAFSFTPEVAGCNLLLKLRSEKKAELISG